VVRKPAEILASRFCVELIDALASRCVEVVRKPAEILDKRRCVEVRRGDASRWPLLRKGLRPAHGRRSAPSKCGHYFTTLA
jgi:hypothetical protein